VSPTPAAEAHPRGREAGLHRDAERWPAEASEQVLGALADGREATSSELRDELLVLEGSCPLWRRKVLGGGEVPAPRVLTALSAAGRIDAVEVDLDGQTVYLLPDDLYATDPVAPWAALLPPLDPTTMDWYEREWYLGPYKAQPFDTSGNAGPRRGGPGGS
jgi:Winged helix DNA-binding domain